MSAAAVIVCGSLAALLPLDLTEILHTYKEKAVCILTFVIAFLCDV